ncbi:DJ-1/PfpI family protein [Phreatobacter stygius]|uniref:DJ-1/PfpI family protein n=1 Tax=Phreatobacter stygius TaxID=1940610 RepID=A0A4D7AWW1_9HYPH|nr:DJ-1/PfpI family protein [Phreatobacter stygius]QCI63433.1 DJ-1/PfpI family protein [Phreatobacter stygius]
MTTPFSIVFPLYAGMTHLDFTGPHQFLSRLPGAQLTVASVGGVAVKADGLTFADLAKLEEIEHCDVLCVPGGASCTNAMQDPVFMAAVRRLAAGARYVTSVCTGSLILGAAGLLEGRRAACHWAWREFLPLFGAIPDPGRVVRDGNLITGGGVTAGIDFAITLAAELADANVAQAIQLGLEYAPAPPFNAGHPDTAPVEIYTMVSSISGANNKRRRGEVEHAAEAYAAGKRAAA